MRRVRRRAGDRSLSLFSTIATIGAPLDVTVAELAIESFFPADQQTRAHFGVPARPSSAGRHLAAASCPVPPDEVRAMTSTSGPLPGPGP
jgi:hypothetical protein